MVSETKDGKVVYRASHANCIPFPISGDGTLMAGIPRNFEVFDPLDFLAEVTQHIPNKGEHQVRYYGWYSNKKRGMNEKRCPELLSKGRSQSCQQSQVYQNLIQLIVKSAA